MTSEHSRHSPQANSKITRLLCITQLMKCAFSEQITKALPKPLPELLQIVTLTQSFCIHHQRPGCTSRAEYRCCLWQQVLQLCNCAAVLTQSVTSIPESDQQHAMQKHSRKHTHRLLERCRLACHPRCTAAMQASSKSFLAAACKGTSQNSLGPCCPHTCHRNREVLRPYRAHAFDWILVRAPRLLDAFCWT